jgi:hypothetical protein
MPAAGAKNRIKIVANSQQPTAKSHFRLPPIFTLTRMPAAGAKTDKNSCQ